MAQFFHRVVHRVGNSAGNVFRHRCFLGQVTFSHRLQFVHQSQNSGLVGVVDTLGFLLLALGVFLLHFSVGLTAPAVQQLNTGDPDTAKNHEQAGQC
ncbi:hypothetical protein D3C86_1852230 [compost metagenome]